MVLNLSHLPGCEYCVTTVVLVPSCGFNHFGINSGTGLKFIPPPLQVARSSQESPICPFGRFPLTLSQAVPSGTLYLVPGFLIRRPRCLFIYQPQNSLGCLSVVIFPLCTGSSFMKAFARFRLRYFKANLDSFHPPIMGYS